jgi:hypothetical protein
MIKHILFFFILLSSLTSKAQWNLDYTREKLSAKHPSLLYNKREDLEFYTYEDNNANTMVTVIYETGIELPLKVGITPLGGIYEVNKFIEFLNSSCTIVSDSEWLDSLSGNKSVIIKLRPNFPRAEFMSFMFEYSK